MLCAARAAAKLCADLNYGGKTDWFLPSKDKLNLMYLNLKGYHDVHDNLFLPSSQADSENTWQQNFNAGTRVAARKGYEDAVRAVWYFLEQTLPGE
jgi:hypothetical protein